MSQAPTPSQQAAIGRIGENIALRSGAGCGKTFVLARRFTELLLKSPDTNPLHRFVALTFTDKAALEMSQRVRQLLLQLANSAKGASRQKMLGWLEEAADARISTIHAFCSGLLRRDAVLAGLDPSFSVCSDELTAGRLVAQACEQAVLAALQDKSDLSAGPLAAPLAAMLSETSFDQVADMVRQLVNNRTAWQADQYAEPAQVLARWQGLLEAQRQQAALQAADDAALSTALAAAQALGDDLHADLAALRAQAITAATAVAAGQFTQQAAAIGHLPEKLGWMGGRTKAAKQARDVLKVVAAEVSRYALFAEELAEPDQRAAEAICTLVALAAEANRIYASQKRKAGLLDFTDLLDHCHALLSSNPQVRRALNQQIDQLLIDECQDTDAFQLSMLLMALCDDDSGPLAPGRLFFVGDAKQSIYRFRGAQVQVFEDLCRRLGSSQQIGLDVSFRSHQAGAAFINHLFAPLMGSDYRPIEARRAFDRDPSCGPPVEIILAQSGDGSDIEKAEQATAAGAQATAQRIEELLQSPAATVFDAAQKVWRTAQPRDIAILFSRMTTSLAYERELSRRGIPYYVVAGTGFFNQQEVFDILGALRAVDNPFDDLAFFGTLRSSLFGLDDNALLRIATACQPPYLPAMMKDPAMTITGLAADDLAALRSAVELLTRLHRQKNAIGIDEIIEQLLDATGYAATLLSQFQGRRMLGNVRSLIEQAAAAGKAVSLADFLTQLSQRVLDGSRYEQAAVAGESENVVRIMTVHKAKGLEFPIVFVPDLNAGRRGFRGRLLQRADCGIAYKPPAAAGDDPDDEPTDQAPLSFRLAKRLEDLDERQEEIRRLYVAMTRHQDHLVLIGADWRSKDGAFVARDSYLAALDQTLGISAAVNDSPAGANCLLPYDDGRYNAAVRVVRPGQPAVARQERLSGQKILDAATSAADLAEGIMHLATAATAAPLLGPAGGAASQVQLAVTALGDFEHCPMLYRWRYELRVPSLTRPMSPATLVPGENASGASGAMLPRCLGKHASADSNSAEAWHPQDTSHRASSGLDAATLGTLLHGCMEHLDVHVAAADRPAHATALLTGQIAQMQLEHEPLDLAALTTLLDEMLARLLGHPLAAQLRTARGIFRELDFVMQTGPAVLRGQIDLLYQDASANWHIVDYKSDRVVPEAIDARAQRYRMQMLLYAAAAGRHLGQLPLDATLYFLRTGSTYQFHITPDSLEQAQRHVAELAGDLLASRRTGKFGRTTGPHCDSCSYGPLCRSI